MEKAVENDVLLNQAPPEKTEVDVVIHDKPKEEERKERLKEEEKQVEVAEPEPKFSKINIGDEPKKSTSMMSKQVNNTTKKESKTMDHHKNIDFRERVSSAGSSSSASSGAELYVGTLAKHHTESHHKHSESWRGVWASWFPERGPVGHILPGEIEQDHRENPECPAPR